MAKLKLETDPALEALIQQRLKADELVLSCIQLRDGEVMVRVIDKELHRVCEPSAKKFGGRGSGSGRTLQFKFENGNWSFVGEGGWIS